MLQTGRVEEVGSGIRNVNKYLPLYAKGGKSEFIEDDMFITNVFLKQLEEQATMQETTQEKILGLIMQRPSITRNEIASIIGLSPHGIKYHLDQLRRSKRIRHIGPTKKGRWEVLE